LIGGINPYRKPVPVFPVPVPIPATEPTDDLVSVSVSCFWLPWIIGALKSLKEQATWDTNNEDEMSLTLQRVDTLIEAFSVSQVACNGGTPPIAQDCTYLFTETEGISFIPSGQCGEYITDGGWAAASNSVCIGSDIEIFLMTPINMNATRVLVVWEASGSGGFEAFWQPQSTYSGDHNDHVTGSYGPGLDSAEYIFDVPAGNYFGVGFNGSLGQTLIIRRMNIDGVSIGPFEC